MTASLCAQRRSAALAAPAHRQRPPGVRAASRGRPSRARPRTRGCLPAARLILQPHLRLGGDAGRLWAAGTRSELICWDLEPVCHVGGGLFPARIGRYWGRYGLADYLVRAVLGLGWGWLERSRSLLRPCSS